MIFLNKISAYSKNAFRYLLAFGIALIIFGILLLIMPELLAYLVSFFFILAGIVVIGMAWKMWHMEHTIRRTASRISDTIDEGVTTIKDAFDKF